MPHFPSGLPVFLNTPLSAHLRNLDTALFPLCLGQNLKCPTWCTMPCITCFVGEEGRVSRFPACCVEAFLNTCWSVTSQPVYHLLIIPDPQRASRWPRPSQSPSNTFSERLEAVYSIFRCQYSHSLPFISSALLCKRPSFLKNTFQS